MNKNQLISVIIIIILYGNNLNAQTKFNNIISENKVFVESNNFDYEQFRNQDIENSYFFIGSSDENYLRISDESSEFNIEFYNNNEKINHFKFQKNGSYYYKVVTSNNVERTIIYEIEYRSIKVKYLLDEFGNEIINDIGFVELSSSGKFLYNRNSLIIYNKNLDQINIEDFLYSQGYIDDNFINNYYIEINNHDNLILYHRVNLIDNSKRYNEGELLESSILVIDLEELNVIYEYEHFNETVNNHVYDFEYKNGSILIVEEPQELNVLSSPIYTNLINTTTDQITRIAEGPFLKLINNYDDNLYRISRQNDQIKIGFVDTKSFTDQELIIDKNLGISDINITSDGIFITTEINRRKNISQLTKLNLDGSINFEITGWFNKELDGLIPTDLNEVIIIKGENLK